MAEESFPAAIQHLKPSIVQIRAQFDQLPAVTLDVFNAFYRARGAPNFDRKSFRPLNLGSGFVLYQGRDGRSVYAVTAAHILHLKLPGSDVELPFGTREVTVEVAVPSAGVVQVRASFFGFLGAEVLKEDDTHDIALLRFYKSNPLMGVNGEPTNVPTVARIAAERPQEGERIIFAGYPLSQATLITTAGIVSSSWEEPARDSSLGGVPGIHYQGDLYLVDAFANPGNSGGPVYSLESHSVIGICDAFWPTPGIAGSDIGLTPLGIPLIS